MTASDRKGKLSRKRTVRQYVAYSIVWSVLWWLISEGDAASWLVGLPTVLAAAWVSVWLAAESPWRWSIRGMLRFAWHFGLASLQGGIDVAWRSLHPRLPIDPGMIEYRTRLPKGTARVFFANAISLCPGTVSARIEGGTLTVHVLDAQQPVHAHLGALERAVAALFGTELLPENKLPGSRP